MTVIGGYLGAGKTTLINKLLAAPHGKRLMVLVNDFGAINIDAELLESASEDTLALTNGCVCCTMGNDLFMAIADVLSRAQRPDHLIVEASGVADPRKLANAAIAEPDMRYGGIVTVVDSGNFPEVMKDPLIAPQLRDQVTCADMVVVSKGDRVSSDLQAALSPLVTSPPVLSGDIAVLGDLVLSTTSEEGLEQGERSHPDYARWQYSGQSTFDRPNLMKVLRNRPAGMFRVKGFVRAEGGGGWTVQVVGKSVELTPLEDCPETVLVGIGLRASLDLAECGAWWDAVSEVCP
jgi:G3E family GTPase